MEQNELMKPRYKVIADYPGSYYEAGETLLEADFANINEDEIIKYPHLFKRLEWHEDRAGSEMPKYVRNNVKDAFCFNQVYKVHRILPLSRVFTFKDEFGHFTQLNFNQTLPATLTEYEEYLKKR